MVARALATYGIGLIGIILIKILAPGFYAKQDIKTPVKIAVGVLIVTQLSNYVFVPLIGHAGLTLSIGVGACLNSLLLFLGLRRRGIYQPSPGWLRFRAARRRVAGAGRADALVLDQLRLDRHAHAAARAHRADGRVPRAVRCTIFRYVVADGLQIRLLQKARQVTTAMTRVLDYFSTLVADDDSLPVTEAALSLAQDAYPDLDLQGTLAEIDMLAARLRRRLADDADLKHRVVALNDFFFRELGFACNHNDYYDPDNSHLNAVLKRRRGIPISLSVLYLELAEQIGVPARGVSFPGHFLLRVTLPDGDLIIDPTNGHSLSEAEMVEMLEPYVARAAGAVDSALRALLQPATSREIIARMLRNLKTIYLQTERWQRLLAVQQRLVILLPDHVDEVRDRGFAYARLDYLRPALEDLEQYLGERPDAEDATVVESQVSELRQRMQRDAED